MEPPQARILLARPQNANRISARLLRELQDACESITNDDSVRVVVLAAEGDDFCAGWDVSGEEEALDLPPDPFGCVARLPQPAICAVQGKASSAGLELALACDIRICGPTARFSLPESGYGALPRAGGTQRLARAVGRGTALAMVLTGEELDAGAAYRAGLVAEVSEDGRLEEDAAAIARSIAARGPIATRYAKEAIHRGLDMTLEQALRYETDLTIILQTTGDRAEGVRAFLEGRRRPGFEGR